MAMLALCQIPKLSACFGIGYERLASVKECPLRWARAFAWRSSTSWAISETV